MAGAQGPNLLLLICCVCEIGKSGSNAFLVIFLFYIRGSLVSIAATLIASSVDINNASTIANLAALCNRPHHTYILAQNQKGIAKVWSKIFGKRADVNCTQPVMTSPSADSCDYTSNPRGSVPSGSSSKASSALSV